MKPDFRNNDSFGDAIAARTERFHTENEKKAQAQACFIDLQKTFDSLDQDVSLNKLVDYSFRGKRLKYFKM